jgi:hypothetical protein
MCLEAKIIGQFYQRKNKESGQSVARKEGMLHVADHKNSSYITKCNLN